MVVAAYRDRTSGRYPIPLSEVRASVSMLFGPEPEQWVLDEANVDPVLSVDPPAYDPSRQVLEEGAPENIEGEWGQTWTLVDFSASEPDPYANFIPIPLLRQRIEALGMWDAFAAYLAQNPAEMLKVLTVEVGVDPAYPSLGVAFDAMDVPQTARDIILAPPSAGVGVP